MHSRMLIKTFASPAGGIDFLPFVRAPRQLGTVAKTGVEEEGMRVL